MKVHSSKLFHHRGLHLTLRALVSSPFSTTTQFPSALDSLYSRVRIARNPKAPITPILEQWTREGREVSKEQLQHLINSMKDSKRFNHALEISQWMTDRRYFSLSTRDVAIRLRLISQVIGVEHAENYFNNISNNLKSANAYGALLNSYVREKSVEKAESIMQQMREMGLATSSFPYNMMINLYWQTGNHDKIDILMDEMEGKGIPHDTCTWNNRMSAYIAKSDIIGMEKILNQIAEDHISVDCTLYTLAASGYLKVGLTEKALSMLKKAEEKMPKQSRKLVFAYLLTLYTSVGIKDEVYRVWNLYKPLKTRSSFYACMITSLLKLDDIEGAEKIFQEWESQCTFYDYRVVNRLLVGYCRKGLFDKAESLVLKAVERGMPYASTWHVLAAGYVEAKQMPKAVEKLKKAMSVGGQGWRPDSTTLAACMEFLEGQGDAEEMEEIIALCRNSGSLTKEVYHRFLRASIAAEKSVSGIVSQMEMDGFTFDKDTNNILETIQNT